jgi:hypothetical protein
VSKTSDKGESLSGGRKTKNKPQKRQNGQKDETRNNGTMGQMRQMDELKRTSNS